VNSALAGHGGQIFGNGPLTQRISSARGNRRYCMSELPLHICNWERHAASVHTSGIVSFPLLGFNRAPPASCAAGLPQIIVLPFAFETHPLSSVGLEVAILWRVGLHEGA
jgi:hypothetical protein